MQSRPRPRHAVRWAVLATCLAIISACGDDTDTSAPAVTTAAPTGSAFSPHQTATYEYLVPGGTGTRLDDGDSIELMPQTLLVKVGESIYIENQDDRDYNVGPFFVAAGQSLAMRFNTATVLSGECLMNPSGEFQIIVEA